jgi:hypothetical protein
MIFKHSAHTAKKTQHFTVTKLNCFMLFKEKAKLLILTVNGYFRLFQNLLKYFNNSNVSMKQQNALF